jgi:predicted kinase
LSSLGQAWYLARVLVVVAGLPGAGKSALANDLGRVLVVAVLSVDPVEAAMWRAGVAHDQPTGLAAYLVVEALAAEQLSLGHDVIVDAVNDVEPARDQWRQLARRAATQLCFVEVRCSDPHEHRRRLESRHRDIEGFPEPTWGAVEARRAGFDAWPDDRLTLDSLQPRERNLQVAVAYVTEMAAHEP